MDTAVNVFQDSLKKMPFEAVVDKYYDNIRSDSTKAATVINYLQSNYTTAKDKNVVAEAYITIASWQNKIGNLKSSVQSLDHGIEYAMQQKNNVLLYEAYKKKGGYLFYKGKNVPALESFLKAYELAKEENSQKWQIEMKNNIALIQLQVKDDIGALDLFHENLRQIEASNDESLKSKIMTIYLNMSKAYIDLDRHKEARNYVEKGYAMSLAQKNLVFQAYFNTFLGEIESENGNHEKAEKLFGKVKELIAKAGGNRALDIFLKLYIGRNYAAQNKHELAVKEFLEGEQLLIADDVDYLSIQGIYIGLADSYSAIGEIEKSSKYYKKSHEIDERNDKIRAILNSRITQEALGNLKEQIDDLEKESQRTKYFYIIGIGILVIIILGLIVYYKKQQRKNKVLFDNLMAELKEKREQEKHPENTKTATATTKKAPATTTETLEIDDKTAEILKNLDEFEAKELFLSQESTLVEVAKKIQTNTTYLSKVINTHKQKSFTAYITDLRVDYAIERLSVDRRFRSFTIGAIAQEIGFKRSESFSKAFKVKTGLYPSYFIKELEKQ
ncbi:AraC family transcriptional regulator [uncultured Kordia sp.]|uniref:AraC family transcriptional regulator n=1 Tax=uncultured Kordia sp. TaxID=507699 RepID=UPI0026329034|nr:AraC family transcriptional regulator [uncultured Kordia sp.]